MIDKIKMKDAFSSVYYDEKSGLSLAELKKKCQKISQKEDRYLAKAEIFETLLLESQVPKNYELPYCHFINIANIAREIREDWKREENTFDKESWSFGRETLAYDCKFDFGHLSFDWQSILELGVPGLIERVKKYQDKKGIYQGCLIALNAVKEYLLRLSKAVNNSNLKQCLDSLATSKPKTLYEALELIIVFYFLETKADSTTIRSIGLLDRILYPFYLNDLKEGKDKELLKKQIEEFFYYFYLWDILNNIPFGLAGYDESGKDVTNQLTYLLLEAYDQLDIISPKIHIMVNENTPTELLDECLKMIRKGHSSILFANQESIINGYLKLGVQRSEAVNHLLVGCYEPMLIGKEVPCTCAGRINLLKSVEYTITDGYDLLANRQGSKRNNHSLDTFEGFYQNVLDHLEVFANETMDNLCYYESLFPRINPTPLFSSCLNDTLENNRELFDSGVKYNNTSINAIGLGSIVDALYAIKCLVYQDKKLNINDLKEIVQNNWQGYQIIRKEADKLAKYGNNIAEVDNLAIDLTNHLSNMINNKPNGRNGVFRLGMFSIDWRKELGEKCLASLDGRLAYTPLSKNIGASTAKDINGVTAAILSATKLNWGLIPNGTVLDIVLHPTSINGIDGLKAFRSLLLVFIKRGGMAIHFNVIDSQVLKKAQKEPENYRNLQIRLCGWNVYFVELSKLEQDEFIAQSELRA